MKVIQELRKQVKQKIDLDEIVSDIAETLEEMQGDNLSIDAGDSNYLVIMEKLRLIREEPSREIGFSGPLRFPLYHYVLTKKAKKLYMELEKEGYYSRRKKQKTL